jgi:3-hydroxymyristoyl/3-hydroxydecanoyl-(acyl carrier protein) dehydratase
MASSQEINIPQKPPMVMVDRIISSGEGITVTSFLIRDDNVFVDQGFLREPGLIENMAQTAAAGISSGGDAGSGPRLGFIGAIRDLKIYRLPAAGDEITTTVKVTHQILNATVVSGEVRQSDEVIAACELRIFLEPA